MLKEVKCKLLNPNGKLPCRSEDSIGYDLYSAVDVVLPSILNFQDYKGAIQISTGISLECDLDYGEFICPRSGLGSRGVIVLGGVIDGAYRGEVKVLLINLSRNDINVKIGDRVAQLIFKKVELPDIVEVDELSVTQRGAAGLGQFTGR